MGKRQIGDSEMQRFLNYYLLLAIRLRVQKKKKPSLNVYLICCWFVTTSDHLFLVLGKEHNQM